MILLDVPDEKLLSLANDIPEPKTSEILLPASKKTPTASDLKIDITETLEVAVEESKDDKN